MGSRARVLAALDRTDVDPESAAAPLLLATGSSLSCPKDLKELPGQMWVCGQRMRKAECLAFISRLKSAIGNKGFCAV